MANSLLDRLLAERFPTTEQPEPVAPAPVDPALPGATQFLNGAVPQEPAVAQLPTQADLPGAAQFLGELPPPPEMVVAEPVSPSAVEVPVVAQTEEEPAEQPLLPEQAAIRVETAADLAQNRATIGQLEAQAEQRDPTKKGTVAHQQQELNLERRKKGLELLGEMRTLQQDISNTKIDADEYFKGGWNVVRNIIGGMMGGFFQGLTGSSANPYWDVLNKRIERSIAAQRAELDKKKDLLSSKQNEYALWKDHFGDEEVALKMTASNLWNRIADEFKAQALKAKDPAIQARGAANEAEARSRAQQAQAEAEKQALLLQDKLLTGQAERNRMAAQASLDRARAQKERAETNQLRNKAQADALAKAALTQQGLNGEAFGIQVQMPNGRTQTIVPADRKQATELADEAAQTTAAIQGLDRIGLLLGQGDVGQGVNLPWQRDPALAKQMAEQIMADIIIAGGRAISDQDVQRLEKAYRALEPSKFIQFMSNDTQREMLEMAQEGVRARFERKLEGLITSGDAALPPGSKVLYDPPRGTLPGAAIDPDTGTPAERVGSAAQAIRSGDAAKAIEQLAGITVMAESPTRTVVLGDAQIRELTQAVDEGIKSGQLSSRDQAKLLRRIHQLKQLGKTKKKANKSQAHSLDNAPDPTLM